MTASPKAGAEDAPSAGPNAAGSIRNGTPAVLILVSFLGACTVSTIGGPIFAPQPIVGGAAEPVCVAVSRVDVQGNDPWLEQLARQAWLERLSPKAAACRGVEPARVEITGLRVTVASDAWGRPADGGVDSVPPQARMRVDTTASARIILCGDGADRSLALGHQAWLPYVADPFARDERVAAVVRELVRDDVATLETAMRGLMCDLARAATDPSASVDGH